MVEMTDISSPLAIAWYLAPRGVQIASVSFGSVFDNVCFHGKKVSQIRTSHSDRPRNIFERTSR